MTVHDVPEILAFGAAEAARRLRAREFSSTELVRAVLARIEQVNPQVNAVRQVLAESALAAASSADQRLAAGRPCGPLDGVPLTVKDNVDVAGTATTHGVIALAEQIAPADAPAVAHLRRAGAIPVARTNMPDFAMRWHTDGALGGATRNPWDRSLTPGGSSGGEAVSLVTGMSLLGVGTDFGGSLRWPSQCAGTAALRPTLGRVPQGSSLEPTALPIRLQLMDVQGPMARRVEDLRLAFEVMAAPDPRDPWHSPVPVDHVPDAPRRVHVLGPLDGVRTDPSVDEALRRAAHALQRHGYELADAAPPDVHLAARAWHALAAVDARHDWPVVEPMASADAARFMREVIALAPTDLGPYPELFVLRHRLARAWSEYQRATPLVLAPIHAGRPFPAGSDLGAAERIIANLGATLVANVLGLPAVAVPVGLVDGLPQAVQLIGPRFGEHLCLDAASAVETAGLV